MTERIASAQNAKVKLAASLKQKKHRDLTGLFLVEGVRLVEEAVSSGWEIAFALCMEKALQNERAAALIADMQARGIPVSFVAAQLYEKACDTKAPQGILAALKRRSFCLEDLLRAEEKPLIAVLDALQDPGNVGTLIRTADAAGCSGVVLLDNTADPFAPKTVRAAMGSLFRLPQVTDVSAARLLDFAAEQNITVYAAALDHAAKSCFAADLRAPAAVVFGNEGVGVGAQVLARCHEKLFIPMRRGAESLNVSVAAAVVLYEAYRQRNGGA